MSYDWHLKRFLKLKTAIPDVPKIVDSFKKLLRAFNVNIR
jgi:hypothetical protein